MGNHKNITIDKFPKQDDTVGQSVKVCFHYDTEHVIGGTIVRADIEEPFQTIFRLNDGRYVLASECQFQIQ